MATRSIYNNICIKDKKFGRSLAEALENAEKKRGKDVTLTKKITEVKSDDIKKMFGDI